MQDTRIGVSTTARPASTTGNGFAWCLMIGGLLLMPFTAGISFGATLVGGLMLKSSSTRHPEEQCNDMEIVAEALAGKQGCIGFGAGCGTVLTILFGFALFALLAMAAIGGGS